MLIESDQLRRAVVAFVKQKNMVVGHALSMAWQDLVDGTVLDDEAVDLGALPAGTPPPAWAARDAALTRVLVGGES